MKSDKIRNTEEVIEDLKILISKKGYIYALCMILFEDFHINIEKLHEADPHKSLSVNEAALLLGFLVQNTIDFSSPKTPEVLFNLKQKTYELMEELHYSLNLIFVKKLEDSIGKTNSKKIFRRDAKEFFGTGDMLKEPIFYSGTGVYDFQYLDFLERKYKYDKDWLLENKKFDYIEVGSFVLHTKSILQEKSKKVYLYDLEEIFPEYLNNRKKEYPNKEGEAKVKEFITNMKLLQYADLFFENKDKEKTPHIEEVRKNDRKVLYKNLIDLFTIKKTDFQGNFQFFLNNFSITPAKGLNAQLRTIGDYNIINSHPIIQLDKNNYFVPNTFLLFQAVYESPYYWMNEDINYKDIAAKNRGIVGEEIAYDFLLKVFGESRSYKCVKVASKKSKDETDIDVLCILGSKVLCVQVKSKKLTGLSRQGNDEQLNKDFQGAVQDAYKQGLISRQMILERKAKLFDEFGKEIQLSEEIDDVYIMGITTENYPSLTHQSHIMLEKKDEDPFLIMLTIFDLELLVHYLADPYDFLYYIRQRISLMEYFKADEEMVYLGYHINKKLFRDPKYKMVAIDNYFGQLIDRNYFPLKAGIKVSDEGDAIKNKWYNEKFDQLCEILKKTNQAKVTDILFYLYDLSGDTRNKLVEFIINTKQKSINDGECHDFSIPPDACFSIRFGITYYSLNSNDVEELVKILLSFSQQKKYRCKGDVWIGFGSLKNSHNMIDIVAFNDQKWKYNEKMENLTKKFWEGKKRGTFISYGREIRGNELCPCGSGLKYKNCHGIGEK